MPKHPMDHSDETKRAGRTRRYLSMAKEQMRRDRGLAMGRSNRSESRGLFAGLAWLRRGRRDGTLDRTTQ